MENKKNKKKDSDKQEKKEKIKENYLEDLQRLQAEFENYIKRINKEKEEFVKIATRNLVLKLINVLDDFRKVLEEIKKTDDKEEISKGIDMVFKEMNKIMEEEGVKVIEYLDKKFDPNFHEVIKYVESEKEEGTVIKEVQKGYLLNDKVLRPTKVIIAKEEKKNE